MTQDKVTQNDLIRGNLAPGNLTEKDFQFANRTGDLSVDTTFQGDSFLKTAMKRFFGKKSGITSGLFFMVRCIWS